MTWADAGRIAVLLVLSSALTLLRGAGCLWGWGTVPEGVLMATVAWFASDGIAGQLLKGKERPDPWEMG